MFGEQRREAAVGEHVAVDEQEVLGQVGDQAQRADGAERLGLERVVDARAPGAVAEEGADEVGLVVHRQGDAAKPAVQLAHQHLKNRVLADRHQRLRQDDRVGPQARALAAGEDDGALRHCSWPL